MTIKELVFNSIKHKSIDKIPLMYRGEPAMNDKLIRYFNLKNLKADWEKLTVMLGPSHYGTSDIPIENVLAIYK